MTDSSSDRLEQLKDRLVETEILAQCGLSFVNGQCIDYVKGLVKDFYRVTDNGEFEVTDRTPLNPDLKPMPIEDLGGWLHEVHPYLFRQQTTPGVSNATTVAPLPNKAEMDLATRCAYIRAHGQEAYEALPNSPTEAKPLTERPRSVWTTEEKADFVRRHRAEEYFKIPA